MSKRKKLKIENGYCNDPSCLCNQPKTKKQEALLRLVGIMLVLLLIFGYGIVMFTMGFLLRDALCTGQLVMV